MRYQIIVFAGLLFITTSVNGAEQCPSSGQTYEMGTWPLEADALAACQSHYAALSASCLMAIQCARTTTYPTGRFRTQNYHPQTHNRDSWIFRWNPAVDEVCEEGIQQTFSVEFNWLMDNFGGQLQLVKPTGDECLYAIDLNEPIGACHVYENIITGDLLTRCQVTYKSTGQLSQPYHDDILPPPSAINLNPPADSVASDDTRKNTTEMTTETSSEMLADGTLVETSVTTETDTIGGGGTHVSIDGYERFTLDDGTQVIRETETITTTHPDGTVTVEQITSYTQVTGPSTQITFDPSTGLVNAQQTPGSEITSGTSVTLTQYDIGGSVINSSTVHYGSGGDGVSGPSSSDGAGDGPDWSAGFAPGGRSAFDYQGVLDAIALQQELYESRVEAAKEDLQSRLTLPQLSAANVLPCWGGEFLARPIEICLEPFRDVLDTIRLALIFAAFVLAGYLVLPSRS